MKKRESKSPSRSTKRALTSSVLALVLCFVMLLGTTFAWFTDTASTKVNSIQAGTLDVALEMSEDGGETWVSAEGKTLGFYVNSGDKTKTIKTDVLWEPGCTYELPAIKVVNNGNLALKYKVVVTAVNGTLANEETDANLADVIDVYMGTKKVGTLTKALTSTDNDGYAWGHLSADSATDPITISLQMQTTAGNEYQNLYIDDIAVTVYATQWTEEYDSIDNQYDKNASYADSWDGNVGTVPTADANGKITITTAADFAAFAEDVNKGNGYQGKTVVLANDIDLNGYAWTPIGQTGNSPSGGDTGFYGTFDGQGHTIYGLNVDTSDLGEGNGNVTAGLFGWIDAAGATIKNVNISGATVKGNHYTGALVGYLSGTVENCSVTNSTVVSVHHDDDNDGDKAGGLVGYMNANATVKNSSVSNSSITAKRDAGGLVGCTYNNTCTVTGNSVSNTTVNYETQNGGEVVGRPQGCDITDNTATNVTVIGEVTAVSTAADLATALAKGGTIVLTADINMNNAWTMVEVTDKNITGKALMLDGNGHTITKLNVPLINANGMENLTIKNLTVKDSNVMDNSKLGVGVIVAEAQWCNLYMNNCHVKNCSVNDGGKNDRAGGLVGYWIGGGEIKNCSVSGTTVYGVESAGGIVGHNQAQDGYATTSKVTNCTASNNTVNSDNYAGQVLGRMSVGTFEISDCTYTGEAYGNIWDGGDCKVIINGDTYTSSGKTNS